VSPRNLLIGCTAFIALALPSPVVALDARIAEIHASGGNVHAALEIKDLFPEKFKSVLEAGGAIYLRLRVELLQHRMVWDRAVEPVVITVFRIVLDPSTRLVHVADEYSEVAKQPAWKEPITVPLVLARTDAISDGAQYYVRALVTLGTVADRETQEAGETVFGADDSSISIARVGKILFHAVLEVNDYLQSISTELRTHPMSGRALKAGVRP
jgi:hypothetical protein